MISIVRFRLTPKDEYHLTLTKRTANAETGGYLEAVRLPSWLQRSEAQDWPVGASGAGLSLPCGFPFTSIRIKDTNDFFLFLLSFFFRAHAIEDELRKDQCCLAEE